MKNVKKEFIELYEKYRNLSEVAKAMGKTRAWASIKAKEYKLDPLCRRCGRVIDDMKQRYCEDCLAIKKEDSAKMALTKNAGNRAIGFREAVRSAIAFYEGCGLNVLKNKFSSKGDPELIVSGELMSVHIKVYTLTKLKNHYQIKMAIADDADYYHLTDCQNVVYIVPAYEVTKPITNIGVRSPLAKYATQKWIDRFVSSLEEDIDAVACFT